MDMINLREAPMVDKPEDGAALFALNPDGTINRIKADGVCCGKIAVIKMDMSSIANATSLLADIQSHNVANIGINAVASDGNEEDSGTSEVPCTCENMTFEDAKALILGGEALNAVLSFSEADNEETNGTIFHISPLITAYRPAENADSKVTQAEPTPESIAIMINVFNSMIYVDWTAEGIIATLAG